MKLFRKFRKKSLLESRLAKYFAYALGEIILVVIGIVIALQINERNAEIKAEERAEVLLLEILDEIEQNFIDIKFTLEELDLKRDWIQEYFEKLEGKEFVNHYHINEMVLKVRPLALEKSDYTIFVSESRDLPPKYLKILSYLEHLNTTTLEAYNMHHMNAINIVEQNKTFMQYNLKYYGSQIYDANDDNKHNDGYDDFETIEFQYRNMVERYRIDVTSRYYAAIRNYGIEAAQCYKDIAAVLEIPPSSFSPTVREFTDRYSFDRDAATKDEIE